jgi:hypothetical protein
MIYFTAFTMWYSSISLVVIVIQICCNGDGWSGVGYLPFESAQCFSSSFVISAYPLEVA